MFLEAEIMATGTLFEILGSASYRDSGTLRRRNRTTLGGALIGK